MINVTTLFDISNQIVDLYRQNLANAGMSKEGALYNFTWNVDFNGQMFQLIFRLPKEWYFVEHGRKPSAKMPPVDAILKWVEFKHIAPRGVNGKIPSKRSVAFAIAKKIQREGFYSPGHHGKLPLQKTFQEGDQYIKALCDEMTKLLNKEIDEDMIHIVDGCKYITKE